MQNKINNVRFQLDFGMIPKIFYRDPVDFTIRCRRRDANYLCVLFNRYYDTLNPMYFPENPKKFEPSEFIRREHTLGRVGILEIALPSDREGSLEYCKSYFIAWHKGIFGIKNPWLYALERNLGGILTIGAMEPGGSHSTLGNAGSEEENLQLVTNALLQK